MDIQRITKTISSKQEGSTIAEDELQALINQYPFASALYAMRARNQIDSGRLSLQDLSESATHFCHSESFINHCIAGNVSELQGQFNPISKDADEITQEENNEVKLESQHSIETQQAPPLDGISNLASDREEPTGQDSDIDLLPKGKEADEDNRADTTTEESKDEIADSQLLVKADNDDAKSEVENPLLDLAHLSDYGSWLLQLKNKNPNQATVEPADLISESVDSSSEPLIAIEQSGEELIEPAKSVQKVDVSSRLNGQIASESLANLLAEQGYHKKAIDMYKKLSLIIPEKSTYFATQIEKIKRK